MLRGGGDSGFQVTGGLKDFWGLFAVSRFLDFFLDFFAVSR